MMSTIEATGHDHRRHDEDWCPLYGTLHTMTIGDLWDRARVLGVPAASLLPY